MALRRTCKGQCSLGFNLDIFCLQYGVHKASTITAELMQRTSTGVSKDASGSAVGAIGHDLDFVDIHLLSRPFPLHPSNTFGLIRSVHLEHRKGTCVSQDSVC